MVNAWSQNSVQQNIEQEVVSLLTLNPDGSLTVHPLLTKQYAPGLLGNIKSNPATSLFNNVEPSSASDEDRLANIGGTEKPSPSHFTIHRNENYRLGRIWASWIRRLMKAGNIDRYEALKVVASELQCPVTDVRLRVEIHNKYRDKRINSTREKLIWEKHLQGMTDRQISDYINLHYKTVAKYRRKMKERQLGVFKNER